MPLRKKLTGLALVFACWFGKSFLAHAGFWDESPNLNVSQLNMFFLIPEWELGCQFHMQLAEKLWQQAQKDFLKVPENSRHAKYLQTVEQQFRDTLSHRLKQAQPPADQSEQTPPEIAHAQFAVTQTLETLGVFSGQVQPGSDPAKALQGIVDSIQVAQDELKAIAQNPNTDSQTKAQWQSVVQQRYQAFADAQALKKQAFSKQATAADWYAYAMHLLADPLCPPTDPDIVRYLFKAAQAGHEQAAFKLLEIEQLQAGCTKPGDAFFQLSQLQVFVEEVRTHFLAHAILAKNKLALKSLIQQSRADLEKGVDKSGDNRQWQALREHLNTLATEANRAYLQQLNQVVKASYRDRNLEPFNRWLSELLGSDVMSDAFEEAPNFPGTGERVEQPQVLETQSKRLAEALKPDQVALEKRGQPESDPGKALQEIVDSIQEAQAELSEGLQTEENPSASSQEIQETKAQWQSVIQPSDQALTVGLSTPEAMAQALRKQAFSKQATAADWYAYAMHLLAYQLCPQTDPDIVRYLLKAAQAGHEDGAFKLLEICQPQVMCLKPGDSFFKLFQWQVEGQSPFVPEVRNRFLAHAILAKNKPALKSLIQKSQSDLEKGVDKSADNRQALREYLNTLATEGDDQEQLNQVLEASSRQRSLEEFNLDPDVMSDDAEEAEKSPVESMKRQVYQLGQPGEPGFGVAAVPVACLPPGFSALPESEDIDSDKYGNYEHRVAGVHVFIPAFVYRVGEQASVALSQKYGVHAIEVKDLSAYLAGFEASEHADIIQDFVQGEPSPEGWQLHRAFVNAGVVQAGFFMQKYLASKHGNDESVTSQKNTVPLSLTDRDGYTRSKDMKGCAGRLGDAYVLAKNTSDVHQVASIFQYSALTMLALAQAQGAQSNQYCAWWSQDPAFCCPKGCVQGLHDDQHDDQKVDLVWQSAGELGNQNKPLTGSCSDEAWASHNGQGNGVMDIKGGLWEVAGAVTIGSDAKNPETLYALARNEDYIRLDQDKAFGTTAELQTRRDVPVPLPYRVNRQLDGTFPLFSGDATYDALALPKSLAVKRPVWPGYDHSRLYTEAISAKVMPVVGGWWGGGADAGLSARLWHSSWIGDGINAGFRLAAYGLTWTQLAGGEWPNGD